MAHPFFESSNYPWHLQAATEFMRALAGVYPEKGRIDTLYKGCGENLPLLNLGQAPDLIWREALINLAPRNGLKKLCESVRTEFEKTAQNTKVIQAVFDAVDPIKTVIFSPELFVLDRKPLRAQLGNLGAAESAKSVLLVRGGKFSGKSWGRHVFLEMAKAHGAEPVYLCDGIVATVEETIGAILAAFGKSASDIPQKQTTDDAWYRATCTRIHEMATSTGKSVWIAVDDLGPTPEGAPMLDTKIKDFFDQFALNMVNPAFRRWFRLMLIHYPEGRVPTRWKNGYWDEDRADEAQIQQADVAEALQAWAKQKEKTIVEDELKGLAAAAIAAADNPQPDDKRPRLERLYEAVHATLKKLSA